MKEYKALKKIFDFSEFQYAQPRDSNSDNQAFITICNIAGEALKERATQQERVTMEKPRKKELLPCPFCGEQPEKATATTPRGIIYFLVIFPRKSGHNEEMVLV